MSATIKAIGFDLDGTLVHSLPGLARAIDEMLVRLKCQPAGETRVSHWIGNGAKVLVERALSWAGLPVTEKEITQAHQLFQICYGEALLLPGSNYLFPHVAETLSTLKSANKTLVIITNKPTPFVRPLLAELGIEKEFSLILGGDDVMNKKPHPAPIYLMLGRLGLTTDEFLFVGDSRNDILAAKAARCPCVGMTYGYNYGEPIAQSQPNFVCDDLSELLPLLGLPPLCSTD